MNLPIPRPLSPCEAKLDPPAIFDLVNFQQLLTTLRIITMQQVSMAFAARS
jgi:hypothetical protein